MENQSTSSTSVNNQLIILREDIKHLKTSILPKFNSIQESQLLVADDVSDIKKNIADLRLKADQIQIDVLENDEVNSDKFRSIAQSIDHLNEGMEHIYYMIKDQRPPSRADLNFFEGPDYVSLPPSPLKPEENLPEDLSTKGENPAEEKAEDKGKDPAEE